VAPHDILALQQAYGNRAVSPLLAQASPPRIQTRLTVNPPGDRYEQEADRVAAQVVRQINAPAPQQPGHGQSVQRQAEEEEEVQMSPLAASITPLVQRQEVPEEEELQMTSLLQRQAGEEEEVQMQALQRQEVPEEEELRMMPLIQRQAEEEEEVQTKSVLQSSGADTGPTVDSGMESRINAAKGAGDPIADNVRAPMEQAFGGDFSGVRVHAGDEADGLNQSLQARAFTTGQDIFFRQGEYNPGTTSGKTLLAHELTHAIQQGATPIKRQVQASRTDQRPKGRYSPHSDNKEGKKYLEPTGYKVLPKNDVLQTARLPRKVLRVDKDAPEYPAIAASASVGGWKGGHSSIFIAEGGGGNLRYWRTDLTAPRELATFDISLTSTGQGQWANPATSTTWKITNESANKAIETARRYQDRAKKGLKLFGFGPRLWRMRYSKGFAWIPFVFHSCATYAAKILKAAGIGYGVKIFNLTPGEVALRKFGAKPKKDWRQPTKEELKLKVKRLYNKDPLKSVYEVYDDMKEVKWDVTMIEIKEAINEWRSGPKEIPGPAKLRDKVQYLRRKKTTYTPQQIHEHLSRKLGWVITLEDVRGELINFYLLRVKEIGTGSVRWD